MQAEVNSIMSKLALLGGSVSIRSDHEDMFHWPIVTRDDEEAVLGVLRRGAMSWTDVTVEFEKEFAAWQGTKHALAFSTGTAAVQSAMYGCQVGVGDEVICPSMTYWASILQCYSLGATPVFADVDPHTLCLDAEDIEHRITDRTKAIVAVHALGYPCDMDPIVEIAHRHGLKVIEDVSHAHGGLYKGRKVGTIGDVGAMSVMSGKALAVGEGGMLATDNTEIYERSLAFGHYERYGSSIQTEYLKEGAGLPLGGYKYRMHQLSSAVGRVQLKHYDARMHEIQKAMNYFWDLIEGLPGIRAHRTPKGSDSTMGGWYDARGLYVSEELGGLSVSRFCEALQAEGARMCVPGAYLALHLHPLFNTYDVYGHGRPTRIANSKRDLRQGAGSLPVSEDVGRRTFAVPWFKHCRPDTIAEYADAFSKVIEHYQDLLAEDPGNPERLGNWQLHRTRQGATA